MLCRRRRFLFLPCTTTAQPSSSKVSSIVIIISGSVPRRQSVGLHLDASIHWKSSRVAQMYFTWTSAGFRTKIGWGMSGSVEDKRSLIKLYGYNSRKSCGYCDNGCTISWGMCSPQMNARHYQGLLSLGWRRCGDYYYRPTNSETCCPSYPIRLEASAYSPSKSQRKTLRTMEKYIATTASASASASASATAAAVAVTASSSSPPSSSMLPQEGLTITTAKASYSLEKFELYSKYQVEIHKDDPEDLSPDGFANFLVKSTLFDDRVGSGDVSKLDGSSAESMEWGTYHQLYRVHGRLIAVGVADLLPDGFSSVYAFYDPDLPQLSLGRYTALKEIQWCRSMGYKYYFMGFYIHSCPKMRYKGEYKPSELLCHTTNSWFPLNQCISLLEQHKFSPFDPVWAKKRAEFETVDSGNGVVKGGSGKEASTSLSSFTTDLWGGGPLSPSDSKRLAVCRVPLTTGNPSELMYLTNLTSKSRTQIMPIIEEWVDEVGPVLAKELVLKF